MTTQKKNWFQCRLSDQPARFGFWEDVCCWKDSVMFVAHSRETEVAALAVARPALRGAGVVFSADGAPISLRITQGHLRSVRAEVRSWQSRFGCWGGMLCPPLGGGAGWL